MRVDIRVPATSANIGAGFDSLGLAVGGAGVVLGLMLLAVTGLPFLLFPACLLLYGAVLLLSFTGRARKAWEEYRQGNAPEL